MTKYRIQFCAMDGDDTVVCYPHRTVEADSAEDVLKYAEQERMEYADQYFDFVDYSEVKIQVIALSNIVTNGKPNIGNIDPVHGEADIT